MSEINPDKAAGDTVPAEAVEAAARGLAEDDHQKGIPSWDELPRDEVEMYRNQGRAALAAAVPLIVADRDALKARIDVTEHRVAELELDLKYWRDKALAGGDDD